MKVTDSKVLAAALSRYETDRRAIVAGESLEDSRRRAMRGVLETIEALAVAVDEKPGVEETSLLHDFETLRAQNAEMRTYLRNLVALFGRVFVELAVEK